MKKSDRQLGMDVPIVRRDFLQGVALGAGLSLSGVAVSPLFAEAKPPTASGEDYPPARTGMRGSHPGSFEAAHDLRDGIVSIDDQANDTGEDVYDLVVVGGGISGLAAAHFFRAHRPAARILILENHDDFGGHAKRNEFHVDGRLMLLNGGTQLIESPTPFSAVAARLMSELGIDTAALDKKCTDRSIYEHYGLGDGVFFDAETFGKDKLVVQDKETREGFEAFLAECPLSDTAKRDMRRIEKARTDHFPHLSSAQKKDLLSRMSYQEYLFEQLGADRSLIPYYRHVTDDLWGCGIDAVSALDCWGVDLPGFQGLKLTRSATKRMGYTPAGYVATGGSPTFHFPDGNASIARLLVRSLIPGAVPGNSAEDVVSARIDYGALDTPASPVRIRLNSLAIRVRNASLAGGGGDGVEIIYTASSDGSGMSKVSALNCVMASWNMMIPYICPELPAAQKAALHKLVKTPLVYMSVLLRNWQPFVKLKIKGVYAPGCYFSSFELNNPVSIGDYRASRAPDDPILVRMLRTPARPGLPERDQHRAGRAELLVTSLETFERETRNQLGRILGTAGFDPARDIRAITVNRWPHGYAPEYNALIDDDTLSDETPNLAGRVRCGRIAIANSDSGMAAYTDSAIDQASRAIQELLQLG